MTWQDDTCDFCGAYIDSIGCDTKSLELFYGVEKYWDGQCVGGMEARWGRRSDKDMAKIIRRYQDLYSSDPIDWDRREKTTPQSMRRRLRQLTYLDRAYQSAAYLTHRTAAKQ